MEENIYINGCDPYKPVLKSLKSFLKNIKDIEQLSGGAIIFFEKKNKDQQDLMMQVFPFKDNVLTCDGKCTLSETQKNDFLKEINKQKAYRRFWHFKQFKTNNGANHFQAKVPDQNLIKFDSKNITYNISNKADESTSVKTATWQDFHTDFLELKVDKNTYEQLLFESECNSVAFIPIPVLSTPAIILVLDHQVIENNRNETLQSLYFRSRDVVDGYLYSRLLDSLTSYLEYHGEHCEEIQMVEAFVQEICNIILPVSYKINGGPEVKYYDSWPTDGFTSNYVLDLMGNENYRIEFKLTSFKYADIDKPSGGRDKWIHESEIYKANSELSTLLLCKLFNLIHRNWTALKSAEERTFKQVSEIIGGIDISGLIKNAKTIKKKFKEINSKRETLTGALPPNLLSIDNDEVRLVVDGIELISPSHFTINNIAQKSGFYYLHYILSAAKKNSGKINLSYKELYEKVVVPKERKVDHDFADKKANANSEISIIGNDIYDSILNSYTHNYEEFQYCIKNNCTSNRKSFNESFYFVAKLIKEASKNKLQLYYKPYWDLACLANIRKVIKIYSDIDKEGTTKKINDNNVSFYFEKFNAAKAIVIKDQEGNNQRDFVRRCLGASITLLKNIQRKPSTQDSKNAMEKLLNNLIDSKLIHVTKNEPASQTDYGYYQKNSKYFIDWQL